MTIAALVIAVLALLLVLNERRHRRTQQRWIQEREHAAAGNGNPPMWDWPINGHDHPEPPELERETTA